MRRDDNFNNLIRYYNNRIKWGLDSYCMYTDIAYDSTCECDGVVCSYYEQCKLSATNFEELK
mgnify:CR=1 FL=1